MVGIAEEIIDLSKRYTSPYDSVDVAEFDTHSVATFLKTVVGGLSEAVVPDPVCWQLYDVIGVHQGRLAERKREGGGGVMVW